MQTISLSDAFDGITDYWSPRCVASLNGQHVRIAKIKGAFVWHHHEHEDEMFLVIEGAMRLEFRDRVITLAKGELAVVPKGVEHRPVADDECRILLFEPATTINTGNIVNERTVTSYEP